MTTHIPNSISLPSMKSASSAAYDDVMAAANGGRGGGGGGEGGGGSGTDGKDIPGDRYLVVGGDRQDSPKHGKYYTCFRQFLYCFLADQVSVSPIGTYN
jgi:hypothetical protein